MDRERSLCPSGRLPRAGVSIGDGPAPIVGVGLRDARRPVRLMRARAVAMLALVVVATILTPVTADALTSAPGSPAAATPIPFTLVSQSPWVASGQSFDLELRPEASSTPTTHLGVAVTVYSCLNSVSGFDQSIASSSGPQRPKITSTGSPLPLSGLTQTADGDFALSMPVTVSAIEPATPAGGFAINLTPSEGQCSLFPSGVYPVRVELVNTSSGQVIGGITTHLIYTSSTPTTTQKLQVAVTLPLQTPITPSTHPSPSELIEHPANALTQPSATAISAVTDTIAALAAHPDVPVTLEASPQTVLALNATDHQSLSQLSDLADSSTDQLASSPYSPVDAMGLVDTGLDSELLLQVERGTQVLTTYVTHTDPAGHLGTWFASGQLDAATLSQLQSEGYREVVLPASAVSSPPANGTTTEPFPLTTSRGSSMTALVTSSDLSARFTSTTRNPVLAAHQLVAELAQMYYEKPNDSAPRGIVVAPPAGWSDNATFVKTLVEAINDNPILEPVTTSSLFSNLPTSTTCRSGCKLVATGASNDLPVRAIRTQRQRINGFATAANDTPLAIQLGDLVLAGEADTLRTSQQAAVLDNTRAALDAQLGQFAVAGDRTIILTSLQGSLPVTILSSAAYPVTASLTVTSDKLLFQNGTTTWTRPGTVRVLPGHHANIYNIPVRARTSGTFKVGIVLHSPNGTLILSSGEATVRSTATSVVGIVLSVGAIVVLAVWWIRTSLKRRARRRSAALDLDPAGGDTS